jgi:hypothetical protein
VPIEFIDLVGDDGWEPMGVNQDSPTYHWIDGGLLKDAPVDMEATFNGAMWVNKKIDPAFSFNGLRCRPNFMVPKHHHNQDELIIINGGQFTVEWETPDGETGKETFTRGGFWISSAGTAYTMTAGPEGVTYTEQWNRPPSELQTTWHDVGWVRK